MKTTPHTQAQFWNLLRELTTKTVVYLDNLPEAAQEEYTKNYATIPDGNNAGRERCIDYKAFYEHVSKHGFTYAIKFGETTNEVTAATPDKDTFTWITTETVNKGTQPATIRINAKNHSIAFNTEASAILGLLGNAKIAFVCWEGHGWFAVPHPKGFTPKPETDAKSYRMTNKALVEKHCKQMGYSSTASTSIHLNSTPVKFQGVTGYALTLIEG